MKVKFYINQILDTRKQGSDIQYNRIFVGELQNNTKKIYYTDEADCDWCFWIGKTCTVIDDIFDTKEKLVHYIENKLPIDLKFMIVLSKGKYYIEKPSAFVRTWETIVFKGSGANFNRTKI